MADIARPVTVETESFQAMEIEPNTITQHPGGFGMSGGGVRPMMAFRHTFRDGAGGIAFVALHCSPDVAEAIAAALNATGPDRLVIDTTNARTVAIDHGQGAVPVDVVPGGRLEPPPHLLDGEEDAPAPAVDLHALARGLSDARRAARAEGKADHLCDEDGIRAVLAALGMEVREDG